MADVQTDHARKEQVVSRTAVFKSVSGINCDMGEKPSPVRALEPHVDFYTQVLGFTLAKPSDSADPRVPFTLAHRLCLLTTGRRGRGFYAPRTAGAGRGVQRFSGHGREGQAMYHVYTLRGSQPVPHSAHGERARAERD